MTLLPVTLCTIPAAVILNFWLGGRIARLRGEFKVSVGDGGHERLLRRMRAQANYIENAPFFLLLLGGLELAGASRVGLAAIALLFLLARISHAFGMDAAENRRWRMYGMMGTSFTILALTFWALARVVEFALGR